MRIRFMGLICHVHRSKADQDLAVLMEEGLHHGRLRVRKGDVFGEDPGEPAVLCEDLSDCTIRFEPLGSGDARNHSALAAVPSLEDRGATGATLHPHVADRDTSGDLRAFVEMPAGDYGVEDFFRLEGELPDGSSGCVARTVFYDVDVPASVTKITVTGLQNGGSIDLKPDAEITITNLEPVRNETSHFPRYGSLFQPAAAIANIRRFPTTCSNGTDEYYYPTCSTEPFKNVGVECSNTTYP